MIKLKILKPGETVFSGDVEEVTLSGKKGCFQVFKGHENLISTLEAGDVSYVCHHMHQKIAVKEGGLVEVKDNQVTVLD